MRQVIEGVQLPSLLLLFGVGVIAGLVGKSSLKMLGFATVITLPLWSAIDMVFGGSDHNLLPIEWLGYALLGAIGTAGAIVGRNRGFKSRSRESGDVR